jgi:hypothetical protein
MSLTDIIKGRKNVVKQESKGTNLAISLINEFKDRKFTLKGLEKNYLALTADQLLKLIQAELENMIVQYNYTTRAKTYTDRRGTAQLQMSLVGKVSMLHRYNPLDIKIDIKTETPQNHTESQKIDKKDSQ